MTAPRFAAYIVKQGHLDGQYTCVGAYAAAADAVAAAHASAVLHDRSCSIEAGHHSGSAKVYPDGGFFGGLHCDVLWQALAKLQFAPRATQAAEIAA